MKLLMATAATALILGTSAYADGHTASFSDMTFDQATNLNASELIGMRVYATESDINNETTIADGGETEWDDIGEINEIVLTRDGGVQSVIVGVGGFVGIGERDVAIDMDQLKFVREEGDTDDFFLVVNASEAGVKDAPEYKTAAPMEDSIKAGTDAEVNGNAEEDANTEADAEAATETAMEADAEVDASTDAQAETGEAKDADAPMEAAADRPIMTAPSIEREGYADVSVEDMTAEDLTGARVYGSDDEDVGEISELLLTDDGKIDRAVIDVGGFLGMGERSVAVTFDELQIIRTEDGSDIRVYIDSTEEALEQQPEYEG